MKKKLKKGFTLVELVIVIAVIAILSAVLIPTFGNVIQNANDSAAFSTASNALTKYTTNQAQAGQSTMLPDGYVIVFSKEETYSTSTNTTEIATADIKYVFEFKNGSLVQYANESTKSFVKYDDIKNNIINLKNNYESVNGVYTKTSKALSEAGVYVPISVSEGQVTYFGAYVLDGSVGDTSVTGKVLLLAKAKNS